MTEGFAAVRLSRPLTLGVCALALLALPACGGVREAMGLEKSAPDEFAVVTKAPLIMPPDYTLRPPQPGAPATREPSTAAQAREALVPGSTAGQDTVASPGESALLERTGPGEADIRAKVEGADRDVVEKDPAFANQIMSGQPSPATTASAPTTPVETQPAGAPAPEAKQEDSGWFD